MNYCRAVIHPKTCSAPGLLKSLTKRVVEHALRAELSVHLGYEPHAPEGRGTGDTCNGTTANTVQTATGDLPRQVPRDREVSFAPVLVPKRQRRLEGFDEEVLALYARGLRTRDIGTWQNSTGWKSRLR